MQKNVSGQKIGSQMVSATDGSAFTGSVTVYVTGDAGTQAVGSVGSGACTHEGNGYHTYAPAQAETNYDLVAFTFIGTGAVPATVQIYTRHDANLTHSAGTAITSSGGRPEVNTTHWAGTAVGSTEVRANLINIAGSAVNTSSAQLGVNIVNAGGTAWASGSLTSGVFASGAITATAIAADAIGASELAADAIAEIADAVWDEDATAHQTGGTFGQAIGDPGADTNTIFAATVTNATGATVGHDTATLLTRLGTPSDLGGGATVAANLSDIEAQTDDIGAAGAGLTAVPWNAAWDAEVQSEAQDALIAYNLDHLLAVALPAEFNTIVDVNSVVGYLAHNNLGTGTGTVEGGYNRTTDSLESLSLAIAAIETGTAPTAAEVADAVWDEAQAGHVGAGTFGEIATEIASVLADTNELQTDWTDGGRLDLIVDAILVDTAEIGAAGAGLTAINLPNQTMDIVGNITGNLSGSVGSVTGAVGSVTGAVGSVTGNVGGNVTGSIGSLATQAKADVQAEAEEALTTYRLHTLIHTAITGEFHTAVHVDSVIGYLAHNNVGTGTGTVEGGYNRTTDSLESIALAVALVDAGTAPTAVEVADAVRTELTTELGRIDVATSTRLASSSYTAPLDAAGTRTAVGLASANLDTQLDALPTAAENAAAVLAAGDVDGYTLEQTLKLCLAALAGKLSGAATTTITIRAADDSKDRITATVDQDGNRTALTLDAAG